MTEYEILYLYGERFNSLWGLIQFWSSVSFGYLALSVVIVKRLNVISIVVLSFLYSVFSLQMFGASEGIYAEIQSFQTSMKALLVSQGHLTEAGNAIVAHSGIASQGIAVRVALYGTFSAALVSLPFQYYKLRTLGIK